ncbi:MAG: hypothetical protein ACREVS_02740 [Burkholderiales bacterium]
MLMKLDTIPQVLVTALMVLGALAASRAVNAAPERPLSGEACYAQSGLSDGQRLVIEIENEKARLGVRGFSPLRNFPVGEVKFSCWSTR